MDKRNEERVTRVFPEYFRNFTLPEGAHEERIKVYRACRTGECDRLSFLPTYEEKGCQLNETDDATDPSLYSLSSYENPKHVKRFAAMTSDLQVPYKIAEGYTDPQYGLVQRTKERMIKTRSSHVDWWLYQDAAPQNSFEMIPDFDFFLANYNLEKR